MSEPTNPSRDGNCCRGLASAARNKWVVMAACAAVTAAGVVGYRASTAKAADGPKVPDQVSGGKWTIHDMTRPKPPVVTPGTFSTQDQPGKPPSDAVVLFDGTSLDHFTSGGGKPATWKLENGYMEVSPDKKGIETKDSFGDVQIHVEWAAPNPPKGDSQGRGNSGLYIMGKYEVQVLDTFNNNTYADGGATAIYGQHPPFANACLPPGQWQVYDIIFRGPRWDADHKLVRPTTITVMHNGVVTQDHFQLTGGTGHYQQPAYKEHPTKLPISFQNHGDPVRYRNVWVRPLPEVGDRGQKLEEGPAVEAPKP